MIETVTSKGRKTLGSNSSLVESSVVEFGVSGTAGLLAFGVIVNCGVSFMSVKV